MKTYLVPRVSPFHVVSAVVPAIALAALPARASMDTWQENAATPAVTITVDADMSLSDALTASGASLSGAASLIKIGNGTVTVDDASGIGSFAGEIHVFQGGWSVGTASGFGTSAGATWVYPNGCVFVTDVTVAHTGEIFHLAGTGKSDWYGWGAIRFPSSSQESAVMAAGAYGSRWILEGDATVLVSGNGNGATFLNTIDLVLNGHDLTLWRGKYGTIGATYSAPSQYGMFSSVTGGGNIVMENGVTFLASGFNPPSYTAGNGLVLQNAIIAFENSASREGWRLTARPLPASNWKNANAAAGLKPALVLRNWKNIDYNDNHDANIWRGPVTLEGDLDIWQADQNYAYPMTLPNKITGVGGLNVITGKAWLYLDNPKNDFQGGVALYGPNNRLVLAADGALPTDGGRLLLTDSTVAFPSTVSAPWSLPALELAGTSVVQNCQGNWKSVTALAGADASYNSALGASNLILNAGSKLTIKSLFDPAAYRGWNEYYDVDHSTTDISQVPYRGVQSYPRYLENNSFRDLPDSNNATRTGTRTIAYSTYLWNHGDSDATWTFAGHFGSHVYIWLNDQQILSLTAGNAWRNPYRVTATLHPGANRLVVLSDNCSWGATADTNSGNDIGTWTGVNYKGFAYAVGDVSLAECSDFSVPTDPGDGSFCTTMSGDPAIDGIAWAPTFQNLAMAPDSLLDLGGRDYTFAGFENAGTVVSNGNASVTNSWTINCAEVDFDDWAPSTFTDTLTIGANAEIVLRNTASWPKEFEIELCTAGATINRVPSVRVADGLAGYQVKAEYANAANTALKLASLPPATVFFVR